MAMEARREKMVRRERWENSLKPGGIRGEAAADHYDAVARTSYQKVLSRTFRADVTFYTAIFNDNFRRGRLGKFDSAR